jgi:hypothetical protein
MAQPKNAFEIFQLLDKSNCRNCGDKTCLAFAGAVFTGRRQLSECPRLARSVIEQFCEEAGLSDAPQAEGIARFEALKGELAGIDLSAAAKRIGGHFARGRLTLKVLGKDFGVDGRGNFYTEVHVNQWVAVPFLSHILCGKGLAPTGRWVSFRELKDGPERYPLFHKRCEQPLKQVADVYTPLFDDMVHLFGGRQVERQFASDISVVLHPLPRVPIMVCYWLPAEGMQSSLNVFFDETADDNLDIGALFALGAGLAQMFTKLAHRHGSPKDVGEG